MAGVRLETSVGGNWEEGVGKTNHDFHRGSFRNAPVGPPISWVPPGISLPPKSPPEFFRRAILRRPHPSGKGRCGCGWILEALIVVPTSLKRGEG
jgi:hypothetical protein